MRLPPIGSKQRTARASSTPIEANIPELQNSIGLALRPHESGPEDLQQVFLYFVNLRFLYAHNVEIIFRNNEAV